MKNVTIGIVLVVLVVIGIVVLVGVRARGKVHKDLMLVLVVPSAEGIQKGTQVKMKGIPVGEVQGVELGKKNVTVLCRIDRGYREKVRKDSRFAIKKVSLFSGERYIDITPGSESAPAFEDMDTVIVKGGFLSWLKRIREKYRKDLGKEGESKLEKLKKYLSLPPEKRKAFKKEIEELFQWFEEQPQLPESLKEEIEKMKEEEAI
ncbi:hypothetical protein DRQ18_03175 [bacterium]|nr:MAG: hypothetical protein DRQ18_03175 [bacterium]